MNKQYILTNKIYEVLKTIALLILYFAICVYFHMPKGASTLISLWPHKVSIFSTYFDLKPLVGGSDIGNYINCGFQYYSGSTLYGVGCLPLFAPGMYFIYKLIFDIFSLQAPLPLIFILLSSFLWSVIFLTLFHFLIKKFGAIIAFFIPLLFILFPFVREFLWSDAILASESIAIPCYILALLLLIRGIQESNNKYAILSGLFMALGCYLRVQVFVAFEIFAIMLLCIYALKLALHKQFLPHVKNFLTYINFNYFFKFLLVTFALCLPYLIFNKIHHNEFAWNNGSYYYQYAWMKDSEYTPEQKWILDGGGNAACKVNSTKCSYFSELRKNKEPTKRGEYQIELIKTIVTDPLHFTVEKFKYLPKYWFSAPSFASASVRNYFDIIPGIIFLGFLIYVFLSIFVYKALLKDKNFLGIYLIGLGALVSNLITFLFIHFEVRYFYSFQSLLFCLFILIFNRSTK